MMLSRLKIQGFRTINRAFDCELHNLSIFVGRNNAGKSCAVRALNIFFNVQSESEFEPHIRINPTATQKKRFALIVGVWFKNLPGPLAKKYRRYMDKEESLPVRLYYSPKDKKYSYALFELGKFSTTSHKGVDADDIIKDVNHYLSLRVIPETRDLAREFQTELGHGFKALKNAILRTAEGKAAKKVKAYKAEVEKIIDAQLVKKINKNLGNIIPDHKIKIGNYDHTAFSKMVLSSLIDQLPISAISDDSDNISIDQMGAGFQSAVLISLYRSVAQLQNKNLILCVEEPEIHLDSHSQRYCYHHWKEEAESNNDLNQVLITSHSAFLVDEASPGQLILVKRDSESCTATYQLSSEFIESENILKLSTKTLGLHNTDLFFSSFVILVEGDGDTVAIRSFLDLYIRSNFPGKNMAVSGVSVINCGGKDSIRVLAKFLKNIGIPYVSVFDRDVIQSVDNENTWLIDQKKVEKKYKNEISESYDNQLSLFKSTADHRRVESDIKSKFRSGIQKGFPKAINDILKNNNILMMRTEHETDIIDSRTFRAVANLFDYDLSYLDLGLETEDQVVEKLKALNSKKLKTSYQTAKIIQSIGSWDMVPKVYATMCIEIFKLIKAAGVRL